MRAAISQVHELIDNAATGSADATALVCGEQNLSYAELRDACRAFATGLLESRLQAGGRVGIYLPKHLETVVALFGTSAAGGTFVPINPVLKPAQVAHIVSDCAVQILVTSSARWQQCKAELQGLPHLDVVVCVDSEVNSDRDTAAAKDHGGPELIQWAAFSATPRRESHSPKAGHRRIDRDMAAILYTSGSTGKPKGVVLSHRNLIAGAESVCTYLDNNAKDRILAALPLGFDAGLSQLTTGFNAGATVVLIDYLLPQDVLRAIERHKITGLTAVPTLWNQLVRLQWPEGLGSSLRYLCNTGGSMPIATTHKLQGLLPNVQIFLMYGLTEAFRSTYLPPAEVSRIPRSIGKAIPNAEVMVVNEQGDDCAPGEPGELVHRGDLVALGYWNDPANTTLRFRAAPGQDPSLPVKEMAVWSGDRVVKDEDGNLYFVARSDEMIKTSGYRVSPSEVEEEAYACNLVTGAAAIGVPHPMLGQAIVLIVTGADSAENVCELIQLRLRARLPGFMQPQHITLRDTLPENQNGKIDRPALRREYDTLFAGDAQNDGA